MTKHTFTLDGTHSVSKGSRADGWTETTVIDLARIPTDIVMRLALHGLTQKIADAASGAKTPAEAIGAMEKARDAILSGEWSSRREASGVDEFTRESRAIMRQILKAKLGAKSPEWAKFTGLSDDLQIEKLDANFAKNRAALEPKVNESIERKKAERLAKNSIAGEISIDI